MRNHIYVCTAVIALSLVGCDMGSKNTKIQYMPDMADAPTVKAQENYLDPPDHAVKVNAVFYPATAEEAELKLENPHPSDPATLESGKALYEKVCVTCHGADGKGLHKLGKTFPNPPDISTAAYAARKDGFFFHRITFGAASMPGYGHSTSAAERWKIIRYLRTLQQQVQP
jgi:mono/diheme cytochrome c family protein